MDNYILGLDEVGTGALAGPAVFCGVMTLTTNTDLIALAKQKIITDSKQLTPLQRQLAVQHLSQLEQQKLITIVLKEKSSKEIDTLGLGKVSKMAFEEIIQTCQDQHPQVILDGRMKVHHQFCSITNVDRADQLYPTVMAASCWAKVHRDNLMTKLSQQYPDYEWQNNKGYASAKHKQAIKKFGLSEFHRQSYKITIG